jgi:hypothetical protein
MCSAATAAVYVREAHVVVLSPPARLVRVAAFGAPESVAR